MQDGQTYPAWSRIFSELEQQQWPSHCLYVVATPIGNMADISPRALSCLQRVDLIACEDTRSSKVLLNHWGIRTALMSAHKHNETQAAHQIIQRLEAGERVALISDAGAPAVSDPGAKVVQLVLAAGLAVRPIPGASAVIAALMGSGVTSDENPAFVFAGFVPNKSVARLEWLTQWGSIAAPIVMFESPHRLMATIRAMRNLFGDGRKLTIARELSKRFEQIETQSLALIETWLNEDEIRQKGEFVLILEACKQSAEEQDFSELDRLLVPMLELLSLKDSVKLATQLSTYSRDTIYARALSLKTS